MEENANIKKEILLLYNTIKSEISANKILKNNLQKVTDINKINSKELINIIKNFLLNVINNKELQFLLNNNNMNDLQKNYLQLENQMRKLETDNKYYLKNLMQNKIIKDSLEMKLNAYMSLEEEYEDLKEKVKYEGGKFLDNDRKDNEIIILRQENSSLKKEIVKLENKNRVNENKIKEYQSIIKELEHNKEFLNKKIYTLERNIKENTINMKHNGSGLYKGMNSNSCTNLQIKSNEPALNSHNDYTLKNLKNVYNFGSNYNNSKNLSNFNSPKNDMKYLEPNKNKNWHNKTMGTINNNVFNSTYNKIVNGINNRKIKMPIKNDFKVTKKHRNNSTSIIRGEMDERKTISNSKYYGDKNTNYIGLNKSGTKNRNFSIIMNPKPQSQSIYPLSCKSSKNNVQIIPKYIHKEYNKI